MPFSYNLQNNMVVAGGKV